MRLLDWLRSHAAKAMCALALAMAASVVAVPAAYGETFDLRDKGVVTPVKDQSPWGTCWSFSAISASEVSLLSDLGTTYGAFPLDLSELHLAWYSYTPLPEDDYSGQGGEGIVSEAGGINGTNRLNSGGEMLYATSLFSSGIGVVDESTARYQNSAGTIDKDGDWSLDPSDAYRFRQVVEFEESNLLPTPYDEKAGIYDSSPETFAEYLAAFKSELKAGRAISIGFYADTSLPGQLETSVYINTDTWAHYTYEEGLVANHGVTIVGYDDEYAKENFSQGLAGEDAAKRTPAGDGAWIAKNSWGTAWGNEGYFYLSYYDKSICAAETYDFDVTSLEHRENYEISQYDYMPSVSHYVLTDAAPMRMTNVFTAEQAQTIRALSCETYAPNTRVTYEVYLLNEGESVPAEGALPVIAYHTDAYTWAGYHRVNLGEGDWCTVPEGQRFAVVVTQQCEDDGKYYVGFDTGKTKKKVGEEQEEAREQIYEQYGQMLFDQAKESESMAGKTDEEIWAAVYERLDEIIEENGMLSDYYWVGVVNEGESLIYSDADDGGGASWVDMTAFMKAEEDRGFFDPANQTYDNFAIKAYSDIAGEPLPEPDTDASAESIQELRAAMEAVRGDAAGVAVSADGSDVAKDAFWVTQAEMDKLTQALDAANAVLESETYPTQAAVDAAADDLEAARQAFADAKKAGAKEDAAGGDQTGGASGGDADQSAGGSGAKGPAGGNLPRTGDDLKAPIFVVAGAAVVAAVVVGGIVLARRWNSRK